MFTNETLNDLIKWLYGGEFSFNGTIYDITSCPDCLQCGLSLLLSSFDLETRLESDELVFWKDKTPGTD